MDKIDITKPIQVRHANGDVLPARFLATDVMGRCPWVVAIMLPEGTEAIWGFDESGRNKIYSIVNIPEVTCPEGYKEAWLTIRENGSLGAGFFVTKENAKRDAYGRDAVRVFIPQHANYDG